MWAFEQGSEQVLSEQRGQVYFGGWREQIAQGMGWVGCEDGPGSEGSIARSLQGGKAGTDSAVGVAGDAFGALDEVFTS